MDSTLIISVVFPAVATAWAVYLTWQLRDWRLALVCLFSAVLLLRGVVLLAGRDALGMSAEDQARAGSAAWLTLALLSAPMVGLLHRSLLRQRREHRRLRLLAGALADSSAAVLITDAGGEGTDPRIVFVNDTICALCGYKRSELVGRTPRIFEGPLTGHDLTAAVRRCVTRGEPVVVEALKYHKSGSTYWASCALSPVRDATGRVTHALWFQSDITARKQADARLQAALQKLSFHVDNSPLGVIEWDREFRVASWSSGAERIFGWTAAEVLGKHPDEWPIVHPGDAERVAGVIQRLQTGAEPRNTCLNRNTTKDQRVIWCQWYNSVLFDPDGRVNSILSLAHDVTERLIAEDRRRLLMLELDHRVRNNLATVLGIAQQSLAVASSLEGFMAAFTGRIEALSRAHAILAQASWEGVDLARLCERVLEPCLVGADRRVRFGGPPVSLSAIQGSVLALTLHELMTNAVKHGALSVPGGSVHIQWKAGGSDGSAWLTFEWAERNGPVVRPPARLGFGTSFIESAIAYELGGTARLEYDASGLRCRIVLPSAEAGGAGGERPLLPEALDVRS